MPNMNDYHAFKSTQGPSNGTGGGSGGTVIIIIVAIMLIYFLFSGASWDAIDTLLGLGFIAYFIAKWLFS